MWVSMANTLAAQAVRRLPSTETTGDQSLAVALMVGDVGCVCARGIVQLLI